MDEMESKSEVAHVMRQIELEYQAAQLGLYGLAYGTAKHEFNTNKMEQMGKLHEKLQRDHSKAGAGSAGIFYPVKA